MLLLADLARLNPRSARTCVQAERFVIQRRIDLAQEQVERLLLVEGTDTLIEAAERETDRLILALRRLEAIERHIATPPESMMERT